MPIYAYKCSSCGHAEDVLQKMSDDPLTVCPGCGAAAYQKQVTAAGFQLKGSGWYATDFRDNGKKPAAAKPEGEPAAKPAADAGAESKPQAAPAAATPAAATPAAPPPAPAPAPPPPAAGGGKAD